MTVIATGPEGSGTHMLAGLLEACGVEAQQRSLPHAGIWWTGDLLTFDPESWGPYPEGTRFVLIRRWDRATAQSQVRRFLAPTLGLAQAHRSAALRALRALPGVIEVRYERIVEDPRGAMSSLLEWLGEGHLPEALPEVRDENAKWTP